MTNLVVLVGRLARPAQQRQLPSGDWLASFEVTVRPAQGKAEGVPVVCFDPPPRARELDVNERVLVVGRVRRRFFRAGGATQSRTKVVAEKIVAVRQAAKARAALEAAGRRLAQALAEPKA